MKHYREDVPRLPGDGIDLSAVSGSLKKFFADRKNAVKVAFIVILLIAATVSRLHASSASGVSIEEGKSGHKSEKSAKAAGKKAEKKCFVDISGAVVKPGVYVVSSDTRIFELIEKAGGLQEDADIDSINRASFVKDGDKIIIPKKGETGDATSSGTEASSGKVNINTASVDELKTLSGVGDAIAGRIVEYRKGKRFSSPEDIKNVKGIGDSTYERIKGSITV